MVYLTVRSVMETAVPNNAGYFRPISVVTPPGSIVNPNLPPIAGVTWIFYGETGGAARATIKRLRRQGPDAWLVRQWNPPEGMQEDFILPRAEWPICHRTVDKHSRR